MSAAVPDGVASDVVVRSLILYRSETGSWGLTCGSVRCQPASGGWLNAMILLFGYLVLRQILRLIVLGVRGERSKDVAILVRRHQVAVLRRPNGWTWNRSTERYSRPCPASFHAHAGPRSSLPLPPCCVGIAT